jgi:Protein of unknown function (DUF4238)
MPKDHYLPAYHIGQFSFDKGERPRDNPIWVKRRNVYEPFLTTASKVGYKKNLYNKEIDSLWVGVEKNLKKAVTDLLDVHEKPLRLSSWLTLVQFVAQLFVRGYEFNDRLDNRFNYLAEGFSETVKKFIPDNANGVRPIELQKLYAPVMYADWTLVYNHSSIPLITNDLGYCCMVEKKTERYGYSVPLFPGAVLALTIGDRCRSRTVPLDESGGEYSIPFISSESINSTQVREVNATIADFCVAEVYGPTKESISFELNPEVKGNVGHDGQFLIPDFDPNFLRTCEMDYFKFLSMIE